MDCLCEWVMLSSVIIIHGSLIKSHFLHCFIITLLNIIDFIIYSQSFNFSEILLTVDCFSFIWFCFWSLELKLFSAKNEGMLVKAILTRTENIPTRTIIGPSILTMKLVLELSTTLRPTVLRPRPSIVMKMMRGMLQ